jgi:dihydrofolate synthase/folylpolyglutamate synthase
VRRQRAGEFSYYGIENTWHNMHTALLGHYQVDNAALAIAACELLHKNRTEISKKNIQDGLTKTRWPGRLEIVSDNPFVILDGAHNLIAARNLSKFLSENLAHRRITLVVGILDDKPYGAMLKSLLPVCARAIITRAKTERALAPQRLYAAAKKIIADVTMIPEVAAAARQAIEAANPDDVICIAGSLYVVGEAKEAIEKGLFKSVKIRNPR